MYLWVLFVGVYWRIWIDKYVLLTFKKKKNEKIDDCNGSCHYVF